MQKAEFEEKDHEGPLYRELLMSSHRFATPGQVFENAFGIDAALEAEHPLFWDFFGFHDVPAGINLPDYRWGWVWRRYGRQRDLPSFPVNLLIQAKRPDYLQGKRSDFADRGIAAHYWRIKTEDHQQEMLERLERQFHGRCLVVYAGAAFHTLADLYRYTEAEKIVENSSFVRPLRMVNHKSWNYDSPGSIGIAASKPELVRDQDPIHSLQQMSEEVGETDSKRDLLLLSKGVEEAAADLEENPYALQFRRGTERIKERFPEVSEVRPEVWQFSQARRLFSLLGLNWLVYGANERHEG